MKFILRYFQNILISIDQLANTLLFGDPDETISSRVGKRLHRKGWDKAAFVIDNIFFWQTDHSRNAIEADEGGNSLLQD